MSGPQTAAAASPSAAGSPAVSPDDEHAASMKTPTLMAAIPVVMRNFLEGDDLAKLLMVLLYT
ncbi:hypothetical protein ACFPRL_15645 [Pseudoclavibacter helvolus]